MKKVLFRILAFALDTVLVSVIILGFSFISFVNPNVKKVDFAYSDYYLSNKTYKELKDNLESYFEDGRIDKTESIQFSIDYPEYATLFDDIKVDEDLSHDDYLKYSEKLDKLQLDLNNSYSYKIQKLNICVTVIGIIVNIFYFGILQWILGGQTLFKKIFRIRVIDKNNAKKKIPFWKYIVRSILVCEILITLADIILLFTLKENSYIIANGWVTQVKYIYEMVFLSTLIIRDDNRSIHDIILNTEVVRFTKDGKVIEERLFNEISEDDEEVIDKPRKTLSKKSRK